jgi:sec-independent protein translocase protein TatB
VLNLDPAKLLVIAVVAVILLGPDKLPQVARQVGAAWRTFSEFRHKMESEVRSSIPDLPSSAEIARLARSPSALLNHLSTMSPDADQAPPAAPAAAAAATPSSEDGSRDESLRTGVPITPSDAAPTPVPTPTPPTSTPDPSLN